MTAPAAFEGAPSLKPLIISRTASFHELPDDENVPFLSPASRAMLWHEIGPFKGASPTASLPEMPVEAIMPFLSLPSRAMLWRTNNSDIQAALSNAGMLPPPNIPKVIPAHVLTAMMPSSLWSHNRLDVPHEVVQSVECLKWAIMSGENYGGKLWSSELCIEIVRHGTLEVLQWVRAQTPPCPWGRGVVSAALFVEYTRQPIPGSERVMLNYMHDSEMKRLGMNSMVGEYLEDYEDDIVDHYKSWLTKCTRIDVARMEVQRAAENGWIPVLHHYWKIDASYVGEEALKLAAQNRQVALIMWYWGHVINWDMYDVIDTVERLASEDAIAGNVHVHNFNHTIDALHREMMREAEEADGSY